MTTLTTEQMSTLYYATQNWDELSLYTDYSGRGMYGDTCVGFSIGNHCYAYPEDIYEYIADYDVDLAAALAKNATTDSLGLGIILYFPAFQTPEDWQAPSLTY